MTTDKRGKVSGGDVAEQFEDAEQQQRAVTMGMWLFLVTELLLFGGLFAGFFLMRVRHTAVFAEAAGHLDLLLGAINTVLLTLSSVTMASTERLCAKGRRSLALLCNGLTFILGAVFLGVKGVEWSKEAAKELLPVGDRVFHYSGPQGEVAELFFNFYYSMTGLHAVHLLIGLALLCYLQRRLAVAGNSATTQRRATIIGLYWSFIDVIWIFVFTSLYLLRS